LLLFHPSRAADMVAVALGGFLFIAHLMRPPRVLR
jgi:hypothetical protein